MGPYGQKPKSLPKGQGRVVSESRSQCHWLNGVCGVQQTLEGLVAAGLAMVEEQNRMNEMRLADEYMKVQTGPGVGLSMGGG